MLKADVVLCLAEQKFKLFSVFLHKSYSWKKSGSWDMGQNAVGQSDTKIFKSFISLEQNDEKAWFFVCWYISKEIKSWLKNIGAGIVLNGSGHSRHRNLTLALSQEGINEINCFCCLIQIQES